MTINLHNTSATCKQSSPCQSALVNLIHPKSSISIFAVLPYFLNMARLVLVVLILAEIIFVQAIADKSEVNPNGIESQTVVEPTGVVTGIADPPASTALESSDDLTEAAEAPGSRRLGKHHSSDKSVAGGSVIIGGLVTAIFAAVFCYIRVTRRRNNVN